MDNNGGSEIKESLLEEIRKAHSDFPLGKKNEVINLPDNQLSYLLALVRNEPQTAPQLSLQEWRMLLHILKSHLILPVIYSRFATWPREMQPPPEIIVELRSMMLGSRANSISQERQLLDITGAFEAEGIRSIVLKGAAFSLSYPDPALRIGTDIDLLLRPEDVPRCRSILERLDFTCMEKRLEISQEGYSEENYVYKGVLPLKKMVDLHWKLIIFPEFSKYLDTGALFSRAQKKMLGDGAIYVLDPVDTIIHASAHMIYHHGDSIRLNWIYDVSILCEALKTPTDWAELQRRCVGCGARLAVEEALALARYWTGMQIPDGFGDFSSWPAPGEPEIIIFTQSKGRGTLKTLKMIIPKSASISDKVRLIYHLVVPSREHMTTLYPEVKGKPIIYAHVLRWRRLLKKL